ncbi:MAG TPA: thioredoxin domain-containing protein [Candidatus Acidoferrales bacterium]
MRARHLLLGLLLAASAGVALAQEPADPQAQVRRRLEGYLRYFYAWGDDVQVKVGALHESTLPGIYTTLVEATQGEQKFQQVFLVGGDGRFIIRGEILDTTEDPFAAARQAVNLLNQPSKGPADAPVTIVEFGDFQCPTCAQIYPTLKKLMAERKDVRIVFKDLPLVGKHDWAYAAAVAGQCAFQQSPEAFWAVHDYFFENQAKLNARNLDAQLDAFAARRAGLDAAQFRACRQEKATAHRVDASLREAAALGLVNTPTLLVNGRPLVGNQPREIIERLINFEVALHEAQKQQQGSAPR